ncbi:type II toxin-antitoxin system VapB family antitoxin [Microbacterium alcoholitolerans]|uniref:type II toxin-antitoxin system VapB family antitoxin n=1 Tax=unclassified Microbacterium TaxID=2609290 RepID=UPI000A5E11EA
MTKTLIDIDDELLARVMALTGASTKKAAVNEALAQAARRGAALGYVDLLRGGAAIELDRRDVVDGAQR